MSETPQAILATWLEAGSPTHLPRIREAIQAVLGENVNLSEELGEVLFERDALRAEVERLERARLRSADWLTIGKLEAERDALRSTVHGLSVQIEEGGKEERALREIMRRLVHGIDEWNAALAELDALRIKAKTWQIRTDTWMAKAASLEGERNASEKRIVRLQEDIVAMKKHHANLEAERDALRAGSDEDARALLHLNDLLTAAESEVARLRAEGLAIADGQIADRERLEGLLRRIVHGIDEWNSAVTPIIGRPVDYKWPALEEARAAAPAEEGWVVPIRFVVDSA